MARTRSAARIVAVAAAVPLALAMFGGVAHADNGAIAADDSNSTVVSGVGTGVEGINSGNSTTNQQAATGAGASNEANIVSVEGSAFTFVDQSTTNIVFGNLW